MPDTIDPREERQLISAAKTAADLAAGGLSPDEAVEKVARDGGFGPGKIRLVAHAYNTGQQLGQWRGGGGILDKLASYPLCDPEKVISSVYSGPTPAEKAAAERVSDEYSRAPAPPAEKRAHAPLPKLSPSPYAPDKAEALHRTFGTVQRAKRAADEARRKSVEARSVVGVKIASLTRYFAKSSYDRLPFAAVESAARSYYGDPGVSLLGIAYGAANFAARGE